MSGDYRSVLGPNTFEPSSIRLRARINFDQLLSGSPIKFPRQHANFRYLNNTSIYAVCGIPLSLAWKLRDHPCTITAMTYKFWTLFLIISTLFCHNDSLVRIWSIFQPLNNNPTQKNPPTRSISFQLPFCRLLLLPRATALSSLFRQSHHRNGITNGPWLQQTRIISHQTTFANWKGTPTLAPLELVL